MIYIIIIINECYSFCLSLPDKYFNFRQIGLSYHACSTDGLFNGGYIMPLIIFFQLPSARSLLIR